MSQHVVVIQLRNHEDPELVSPEMSKKDAEAMADRVRLAQVPHHVRTVTEDGGETVVTHNAHGEGQPGDVLDLGFATVLASVIDGAEIREV